MEFMPAESVDVWALYIPKGSQFEFNNSIWGATTHHYLTPIQDLINKQFNLIVDDIHQYVKVVWALPDSLDLSDDDDFDDLFAFCW